MKHAPLLLTLFVLWSLLGCGRKPTDDNLAPPPPPSQPQAPLAGAETGAKPRAAATKSLLQAAVRGDVNDATVALGRDPEAVCRPNAEGFYPIHLAAERGHSEVIRVLLRAGADVNTPHPTVQATPLQYAAMHGHLDAVRTLLAAGARVDPVDSHGLTPLMWAAWKGHVQVVQELLKHGADVHCKTKTGWTALRYAEQKGHAQVAELLRK